MKTYNREMDPSIIEIDKENIDNLSKYPSNLVGEDNNVNKENIFKKMATKIRSGRIDEFFNDWSGK